MTPLTSLLLANTVLAALLAAVAAACRRPALAHAAYLLALVRLVLPVGIGVPWGPTAVAAVAAAPATHASAATLLVGWVAGSIAVAGLTGVRALRFARLLRDVPRPPATLVEELGRVARRMRVRPPRLAVVAGRCPPVLFAWGRPTVVLSAPLAAELAPDGRAAVFAHELAHLRRRDHWVRWGEAIVTVLLWWHPLLWAIRAGLHAAEEQCCDAVAARGRRAYAAALVDVAAFCSAGPPLATGMGAAGSLRRRVARLVSGPPVPRPTPGRLGWVVLVVLVPLLLVVPARVRLRSADDRDRRIAQLESQVRSLQQQIDAGPTRSPLPDEQPDPDPVPTPSPPSRLPAEPAGLWLPVRTPPPWMT